MIVHRTGALAHRVQHKLEWNFKVRRYSSARSALRITVGTIALRGSKTGCTRFFQRELVVEEMRASHSVSMMHWLVLLQADATSLNFPCGTHAA